MSRVSINWHILIIIIQNAPTLIGQDLIICLLNEKLKHSWLKLYCTLAKEHSVDRWRCHLRQRNASFHVERRRHRKHPLRHHEPRQAAHKTHPLLAVTKKNVECSNDPDHSVGWNYQHPKVQSMAQKNSSLSKHWRSFQLGLSGPQTASSVCVATIGNAWSVR